MNKLIIRKILNKSLPALKKYSGSIARKSGELLCKLSWFICRIAAFTIGIWIVAAMPVVLRLPEYINIIFAAGLAILFLTGSRRRKGGTLILLTVEAAFIIHFAALTPEEQFKDVKFRRVFAVKPAIRYLDKNKFEVINLRKNRYPADYDENATYCDIFVNEFFDLTKVESMQFITVYWDGMWYAAHNMLNFKFSDGKELTVSVEPRTPVGVDRKPFTCLCKQQELLFILSDPEDLLDLRNRVRGEDMYIFETSFTPLECRKILSGIISKAGKLHRDPEFYDLIKANCITALLPYFRHARPELQWDVRCLFNGLIDRMLFDQNVLARRPGESFESLKSRSFIKGKSQGKL